MRLVGLGSPNPILLWSNAMTRDNQFSNSASQAERRKMLQLEQASTLLEQAKISETLDSVRMKSTVVGTDPVIQYPAGSGPWSGNYWQDGPEPPINAVEMFSVEPVGTPAEVQRSLDELAGAQAPASLAPTSSLVSDTGIASPPVSSETGDVAATPPPPKATDRPLKLKRLR
jgi:hypothetical protein